MKPAEIKSLLRYVLGSYPDLVTTDYGVEWDGSAWSRQWGRLSNADVIEPCTTCRGERVVCANTGLPIDDCSLGDCRRHPSTPCFTCRPQESLAAGRSPMDPLGAILFTRQPVPPEKVLREYGPAPCSCLGGPPCDRPHSDSCTAERIFPGLIARETLKEFLGVDATWLDEFFGGLEGRPAPVGKSAGWDCGSYAYNRMHPQPEQAPQAETQSEQANP